MKKTKDGDIAAGSNPDGFLKFFHDKYPGCSSRAFSSGRITDGGRSGSSYDLVASVISSASAQPVILDVGCGDGFLLETVGDLLADSRLIGIDMSAAELAKARARSGLAGAELRCERVHDLSLPDSSVDFALSHMALMLMQNVEDAIAQIARVLKPGGYISTVVGARRPEGGALDLFVKVFRRVFKEYGGQSVELGDPRTRSSDGLCRLFCQSAGFDRVSVKEVRLVLDGAPGSGVVIDASDVQLRVSVPSGAEGAAPGVRVGSYISRSAQWQGAVRHPDEPPRCSAGWQLALALDGSSAGIFAADEHQLNYRSEADYDPDACTRMAIFPLWRFSAIF